MFKIILLLTFHFSWIAQGQTQLALEAPFPPVLAADQAVITTKTITEETSQFRLFGLWQGLKDQVKTQALRRDNAKKNYERTLDLFEKGDASEIELKTSKHQLDKDELDLKRLKAQSQRTAALAEIAKWKILSGGNPGQDHRKSLALSLQKAQGALLIATQMDHQKAQVNQGYYKFRLNSGRILFEKDFISKTEMEKRELEYRTAVENTNSFVYQIDSQRAASKALQMSIDKL